MNLFRHQFLAVSLIAGSVLGASASDFDQILDEIVRHNWASRAEYVRSEGELAALRAENELAPVEVEFGRVWGSNAEVGNKLEFSVSQSVDWPGLYRARREAAAKGQAAMEYLYESRLLELRNEARLLLIDIVHNNLLINLQADLANRMDKMEEYYRKAAEVGQETRLDYNKTVVERIAVHRELHSLEAQREALRSSFETLNGGRNWEELYNKVGDKYPVVTLLSPDSLMHQLEQRDPSLIYAKAQYEAAKSLVKVEKMKRYPGFSIGYAHETELGGHFNGFTVGITLPVWSRKHSIIAANDNEEATELEWVHTFVEHQAKVRADYAQLSHLREIMEEYEPVVNDHSNFDLLKKALDAGQIDFLTYLQEVNFFIAAIRDYYDTLYEYNLALARLQYYM